MFHSVGFSLEEDAETHIDPSWKKCASVSYLEMICRWLPWISQRWTSHSCLWIILFWIPCPGGFQRFPQTSYPPGSAKLDSCRKWRRKFSKEAPQVLLWKHLGPGVSTCFNRKFSGTSAILCAPQIRIQCEVPADALTNGSEQLEEAWGSTDLGEHGFSPMFTIKYIQILSTIRDRCPQNRWRISPKSLTDLPKIGDGFPHNRTCFQKPNHFFTKSGASFCWARTESVFPKYVFSVVASNWDKHTQARSTSEWNNRIWKKKTKLD